MLDSLTVFISFPFFFLFFFFFLPHPSLLLNSSVPAVENLHQCLSPRKLVLLENPGNEKTVWTVLRRHRHTHKCARITMIAVTCGFFILHYSSISTCTRREYKTGLTFYWVLVPVKYDSTAARHKKHPFLSAPRNGSRYCARNSKEALENKGRSLSGPMRQSGYSKK